jgi:hypothetical protein
MLLLRATDVAARRAAAATGLAPLAASLQTDLDAVLARELFVPPEKARLTRVGGRCTVEGALLGFDPWSPHRQRCPSCGAEYERPEDYRWWIMWYQLWLAERSVHAAALHLLTGSAHLAPSPSACSTPTPTGTSRIRTRTTCSVPAGRSSARTSSPSGCCSSASPSTLLELGRPERARHRARRDRVVEPESPP